MLALCGRLSAWRASAVPCPLVAPQFRPLTWRQQHPYLVADRFEDMTDPEALRADPGCDRTVALYGYVRGASMKPGMQARCAALRYAALRCAALHAQRM